MARGHGTAPCRWFACPVWRGTTADFDTPGGGAGGADRLRANRGGVLALDYRGRGKIGTTTASRQTTNSAGRSSPTCFPVPHGPLGIGRAAFRSATPRRGRHPDDAPWRSAARPEPRIAGCVLNDIGPGDRPRGVLMADQGAMSAKAWPALASFSPQQPRPSSGRFRQPFSQMGANDDWLAFRRGADVLREDGGRFVVDYDPKLRGRPLEGRRSRARNRCPPCGTSSMRSTASPVMVIRGANSDIPVGGQTVEGMAQAPPPRASRVLEVPEDGPCAAGPRQAP